MVKFSSWHKNFKIGVHDENHSPKIILHQLGFKPQSAHTGWAKSYYTLA